MKVIGITQARVGSSRLPGKVLMEIEGISLLEYHLTRATKSASVHKWIVATTLEQGSEKICAIAEKIGVDTYRGDIHDVLSRFYHAAGSETADYIVRITSDCPLIDPALIDEVTDNAISAKLSYSATSETFPDGVDVEIFSAEMLSEAFGKAELASDREHVTPFMRRRAEEACLPWKCEPPTDIYSGIRITVDQLADYEAIAVLLENLGRDCTWIEYSDFVVRNPSLFTNQIITRNEGYIKSLENDKIKED